MSSKDSTASTKPMAAGKTSAVSAEEPKKVQVITGKQILVGQCSFQNCPYDENSKLATNMGVVQLKNTNYIFHPDCYQKFGQQMRSEVTGDPADRIDKLREQNAREVTLQNA